MVYSSSAMKAYLERDDTFAIVGPQIVWAALGIGALLITMRIDYRLLRLAAVPLLGVAFVFLVIVLLPPVGPISPRIVGGSARWLQIGPLPSVHPAEFAKLALVVYLASWLAQRGTRIKSFVRGTVPFLLLVGPVVCLVLLEPDLGTSSVLGFTAFTMFFLAGARLLHLAGLALAAVPVVAFLFIEGYQVDRSAPGWTRGRTRPASASTRSRATSRSRWVASPARGSAKAGSRVVCSCPTPRTTSSSRSSARSSGWSAGSSSSCCSSRSRTLASARPFGRRTRSARCSPGASRPGSASRRSSTSASWWGCSR